MMKGLDQDEIFYVKKNKMLAKIKCWTNHLTMQIDRKWKSCYKPLIYNGQLSCPYAKSRQDRITVTASLLRILNFRTG